MCFIHVFKLKGRVTVRVTHSTHMTLILALSREETQVCCHVLDSNFVPLQRHHIPDSGDQEGVRRRLEEDVQCRTVWFENV